MALQSKDRGGRRSGGAEALGSILGALLGDPASAEANPDFVNPGAHDFNDANFDARTQLPNLNTNRAGKTANSNYVMSKGINEQTSELAGANQLKSIEATGKKQSELSKQESGQRISEDIAKSEQAIKEFEAKEKIKIPYQLRNSIIGVFSAQGMIPSEDDINKSVAGNHPMQAIINKTVETRNVAEQSKNKLNEDTANNARDTENSTQTARKRTEVAKRGLEADIAEQTAPSLLGQANIVASKAREQAAGLADAEYNKKVIGVGPKEGTAINFGNGSMTQFGSGDEVKDRLVKGALGDKLAPKGAAPNLFGTTQVKLDSGTTLSLPNPSPASQLNPKPAPPVVPTVNPVKTPLSKVETPADVVESNPLKSPVSKQFIYGSGGIPTSLPENWNDIDPYAQSVIDHQGLDPNQKQIALLRYYKQKAGLQ
jgi:hypothetical protein